MKLVCALLLGVLLVAGSRAQEACDPVSSAASLIDLTESIGKLACKVPPSVDLTAVMSKLTGTLKNLNADQLKQLPPLLELMVGIDPAALQPFLGLSAAELDKLIPLMTEVPMDTLKVALPLLAKQDAAVLVRMIKFLKLVSRQKLEQLSPLFGRMTQGQINILIHMLNNVPEHLIDMLIHMVQALGPVTDAGVAIKQQHGLIGSGSGSASKSVSFLPHVTISSAAAPAGNHSSHPKPFSIHLGGRRLLQAGGCNPQDKGLEVSVNLLGDFGAVVCKFGPDTLKPSLQQTLDFLNNQSPETLAKLPALTDVLTQVDPAVFQVFFKIPPATLKQVIPVMAGIESSKLSAQLKLLASQDSETISKMIFFLKSTPASQMELLVGMFAKVTDRQVELLAKFMNALSPGQIALSIHLLDHFGFAVDAIGRAIPDKSKRAGSGFSIGGVQVVYDSSSSASHTVGLPLLPPHPLFHLG